MNWRLNTQMKFQCKVALIWCEWFTHRAYTHFIYYDVFLSQKVVLI